MDIDKIGEFIKELRMEKGLSQNQLSEELHITRQAISNWENGKAIPDSDVLLLLSSFFNISINEILSGKRLGKDNNYEEIALQLVDENNKKNKRINKMIKIFSASIATILLIFLGYYFINNYNSIKVYKIDGKSDNFYIRDGLLIMTKNKTYLQLGEFEQTKDEKEIETIKVYYVKNGKEIDIFERDDSDFLIKRSNSYDEYIIGRDKKYILNNLFLEVTYKDKMCSVINLRLTEEFKNTFKYDNKNNIEVTKESNKSNTSKQNHEFKNILDEEIEKTNLLSEKRIQYEIEDNQSNNIDNSNSQETEQIIEENTPVESNIKEEPVVGEVINQEEQEPTNEEEPLEEINYDELINLIKEKGTLQFGQYIYEFQNEDKYYSVSVQDTTLTIAVMEENVIKEWLYFIDGNRLQYNNLVDYIQNYTDIFLIDDKDSLRKEIYNDYINNIKYVLNYLKGN